MSAPSVDELLAALTEDEKVLLLAGRDFWHTHPVERLGIPALQVSDGPSGVRGERSVGTTSVSFPCASAVGASFDRRLAAELGSLLADECLDRGVHALLGPTVNLHRHPLGGRHFECYSEDPLLTAELAVAYVTALQDKAVAATVKHFVANDTEFERHTISSQVDEQVLRELYFLPFEATVRRAGAWAVMASYNRVNGTYAAEHPWLLQEVLRDEWGFDGVVVSDWFGTQSTVPSAMAGLDLEMPGPAVHYGERLAEAVRDGEVPPGVLDDHVRRLLVLAERTGALGGLPPEAARSRPEERSEAARRMAAAGFVLLSNATPPASSEPVLPLTLERGARLAVVGPNAAETAVQGGGSARVNPAATVSILEGLREAFEPLGVEVAHEVGCTIWMGNPTLRSKIRLEYHAGADPWDEAGSSDVAPLHVDEAREASFVWMGDPIPGKPEVAPGAFHVRMRAELVPAFSGSWVFSLTQVGRAVLAVDGDVVVDAREVEPGSKFFGMGSKEVTGTVPLEAGRPVEVTVDYGVRPGFPLAGLAVGARPPLPEPDELLARAVRLAADADAVVVVVGTDADWETEGRDRRSMDLPGRQDELVRAVAAANPRSVVVVNAGSPVTMDWADEVAAVGQCWFPGEQGGRAVADVLSGASDPGGRLPTSLPRRIEDTPAFPYYPGESGKAEYGEGRLVGYRHYAANGVEPRFAFGHGLSYTSFELSELRLTRAGAGAEVSVRLRNTGGRLGSTVVQCYLRPGGNEPRLLAGFEKLALGPGEDSEVRFRLEAVADGDEVLVGRSSLDLPLAGSLGS